MRRLFSGVASEEEGEEGWEEEEEGEEGGGGVGRGEVTAEDRVGEADFAALAAHEGDVGVVQVGGAVA